MKLKKENLIFRFTTEEDAEKILKIYKPYVENTTITFEYEVPSIDEFKGRIRDVLEEYPYISFEQGDHNSFYFSEEIFSTVVRPKHIRVRDRASLFSLLLGLDGYTVSSGVIDKEVNGENIISVPLAEEGLMHIGYITNNKMQRSRLGQEYIHALEQYVSNYGRHIKLPENKK